MRPAATASQHGAFTGRHLLLIMLAFFAVVIGVNLAMAFVAGSSWTGFVVKNSYVASQEFNGKVTAARAQAGLGWTARLSIAGGRAELSLADSRGRTVPLRSARLLMRNPASDRLDRDVVLSAADGGFGASIDVRDGLWIAEIVATTADGSEWRNTRRLMISEGRTK